MLPVLSFWDAKVHGMSKRIVIGAVVIVLVATAIWLMTREGDEPFRLLELSVIDDPAQLDELHLELADLDPTSWIRCFRPGRASSGFNLVLYRRGVPMIIDMNGNIVHLWPRVRAIGRARLRRYGRLALRFALSSDSTETASRALTLLRDSNSRSRPRDKRQRCWWM